MKAARAKPIASAMPCWPSTLPRCCSSSRRRSRRATIWSKRSTCCSASSFSPILPPASSSAATGCAIWRIRSTWADIAAIVSFLAPLVGEAAGFLRILRTLAAAAQLSAACAAAPRTSPTSAPTRRSSSRSPISSVFLFVMTGVVYETQHGQQSGNRQLCRRALFHRHGADHHRLRRHHAAGHDGPADLGRHHDLRRHAVLRAGARGAAPQQGALSPARPAACCATSPTPCTARRAARLLNIPNED